MQEHPVHRLRPPRRKRESQLATPHLKRKMPHIVQRATENAPFRANYRL